MPRKATLSPRGPTSIAFDPDIREYLLDRMQREGRTLKWIVNNALRKEKLAEEERSLASQQMELLVPGNRQF